MSFFSEKCIIRPWSSELIASCNPFDCQREDLNDFFRDNAPLYEKELLGKTYCFINEDEPTDIVCAFTVSNDSIKKKLLPRAQSERMSKDIPREKRGGSYPAVLIGRLGVNVKYWGKKVGPDLMDFIKAWFSEDLNKTGCRFIVVDSYNDERPIKYYQKCGFEFVFRSEEEEKEYMKPHLLKDDKKDVPLDTRLMFFDLIVLK